MAGKKPRRVLFIEVQPSQNNEETLPHKGKNDNAVLPQSQENMAKNSKFIPSKPPKTPKGRRAVIKNSSREDGRTISNQLEDIFLAREAKNNTKEEIVQDQLKEKKDEDQIREKVGVDQPIHNKDIDPLKDKGDEECVEGKKEKGKKRKKKKKRKNRRILPQDEESGRTVDALDRGAGIKENEDRTQPAKKTKETKTDIKERPVESTSPHQDQTAEGAAPSRRKLPCLFGFIATWIAKRKEKRREKKRKAIASRDSLKRLVEYEHRTARGGEAFTLELDSRPMTLKKPLLPPIKQTSGPIRREKHQDADLRRYENLARRMDAARSYERKRTRCKENRAETDRQFRHKTELAIRQKQVIAERNRELQSRCKSKLRTPSPRLSPEPLKEPSAESSLGSVYGPSLYSDNEVDRDDLSVDIPIF